MTDAPKTIVTVPIQPVPVIETAKLGVIYHAPLATALTPGIVQIGTGLLVSAGLVEVDPSIIKIEQITLNGDIVLPDENKSVNLTVDKTTVGLSNVDNTSDLDKPISNATQTAFDVLSSEIQTELAGKLSIQQNVINFGKILYIKSDGTIGFKQENVETNNEAFINVSLNTTTGILQFTRINGEILEVDFPLEELVSDGYYDTQTEEIVLVLANGNEIRFSASTLVNIYEGDGNTVVTYIDPQTGANKIKVADAVINRLAAAETNIGVLNTAISQEITNREAADTLLQQAVNLKANKTTAIGDFIVSVNQSGTQLTFTLKDCSDTPQTKDTKTINLPDAVVSGTLDDVNEKITLTLASGQLINIDLSDLYDTLTDLRTAIDVETAARGIAIQTLDTNKVDKITGKGLSTNDFDNNYKSQIEANTSAIQVFSQAVLYDVQTLTNEQKAQVRTNIGAGISNFSGAYADLTGQPTIPVKVSDLTNDTGFIINTVSNLTNYYLKSETYTKTEVQNLIAAISTLKIQVVQTLPTQDISLTTIYLVPKTTSGTNNIYDEYVYINNAWEKIGDTQIDLSNYYTKTQTDALLAEKQNNINNSNKLNADLVDDTNATHKFVTTSEKNTWDGKQNALSTAQLNAVNSGVTSATVSQVTTNTNNISSLQTGKQDKLTAGTNITIDPNTNTISATGGSSITSINGLAGGSLTSPLIIKGGDATTADKIALDHTQAGQITDEGTGTLFGFLSNNATTLTVGGNSYALNLRGTGTRPQYKGNNMALYSDVPTKTSQLTNDSGFVTADTGATSVATSGSGNAVNGASYNPTTRVLTLLKNITVLTDVVNNLATDREGQVIISNGLLIQWGRSAIVGDNKTISVTFTLKYKRIPCVVTSSEYSADDGSWNGAYYIPLNTISTNGFQIHSRGNKGGGRYVTWFAIGLEV